jgi:hypothetical protein
MSGALEQEARHGDMDHGFGDVAALLVVADQATPASGSAEGPLDEPSSGRERLRMVRNLTVS